MSLSNVKAAGVTMQAADIAGFRTFLVHAEDDAARSWYEGWGFEPSPTDSYHLFLLLKY